MKCLVVETSPEHTTARPVTNEDGTPHTYATMAEARAELKANGYSYNRENQRYYIKGTEYHAYIVREDSEDYAEIIAAQAHANAARRLVSAYAEAIGEAVTDSDPEAIAARQVAREAIGYTTATEEQHETVAAMVEAIAARWMQDHQPEPEHIQTVNGNKIYRSVDPVTGWNVFTVAGRDFWELAEARYFAQCNPTDPAKRAEIIAKQAHEDMENARECMEEAAYMLEVVAEDAANEDAIRLADHVGRVWEYATEASRAAHAAAEDAEKAGTAAAAEDAAKAAEYADQADKIAATATATKYARLRWATWSRENIAAYLGDVTAYDIDAILEDMHDTGDCLEDVAERHQVVAFWPAA